ncbi:MAG TPA: PH domain-containing protein [Sphingomicrobium sp.]|nr:PH domain-containing protein [Sphingomicrobium sp.]
MGDALDHGYDGSGQLPLLAVEPAYKNVLRSRFLVQWVALSAVAVVVDQTLLSEGSFHGLPSTLVPLLGIISLVVVPQRIYGHLGYRIAERLLQVVRGWMFHTDTLVPFVRVQHIDVTQGPLEKLFGVATLVVHTAGTHNSVVTVPGLAPQRAAEIRDIIREHVRTDLE